MPDTYDDENTQDGIDRDLRQDYGGVKSVLRPFAGQKAYSHYDQESAKLKQMEEDMARMKDGPDQEALLRGAQKMKNGEALSPEEEAAYERFGKQRKGQKGSDYTDFYRPAKGKNPTKLASLLKGSSGSKLKKKLAIAGALAGGGTIGGIMAFIALLPFKLEHIISNMETKYMAAAAQSLGDMSNALLSDYLVNDVMPQLGKNNCARTIDPACRAIPTGTGPIKRLYKAWSQARLEQRLATKYGIVIGKKGGDFYISTPADRGDTKITKEQWAKLKSGEMDAFDLPGMRDPKTRTEIRKLFKQDVHLGANFDRFFLGRLLETKFGIKRCIFVCKINDKVTDTIIGKKLGAAILANRLGSDRYQVIMGCILAGSDQCSAALDPAKAGDTERSSPVQRQIRDKVVAFAAEYVGEESGKEAAQKLIAVSDEISREGFSRYVVIKALSGFLGKLGVEGSTQVATKAVAVIVPGAGWIKLIASVVHTAATIGPMLSSAAFAATTGVGVAVYAYYKDVPAEAKTGQLSAAELDGVMTTISTSMSGNPAKAADITASPAYQALINHGTGISDATAFGNLLFGSAYADSIDTTSRSAYKCDDGNPVPEGQLVCKEENLRNNGNAVATGAANIVNSVPGLVPVAGVIDKVSNAPGDWANSAIEKLPGFSAVGDWVGSQAAGPMETLQSKLITVPDVDSGARQGDMAMIGADTAGNASCKIQLGCAVIDDKTVAALQSKQLADEQNEFDSLPLFARVFSTDTPYSLLSRVAVSMPSNFAGITSSGLASLLTNPLGRMGSLFSSAFATNHAFAAITPRADLFGITQYGYPHGVPRHPQKYWDQNCQPLYNDSTETLDETAWLNSQEEDSVTHEAVATTTNPCLLINTAVGAAGGWFDTKLLPPDSANP